MAQATIRSRSYLPLVILALLLVLQIFSPAPPIKVVFFAIGGVQVIAYLWAYQMSKGIVLQRQRRYGWAQVGDIIEERFNLHNDAWLPILWAEVRDHSDLPGYNASRATGLGPRASSRWTTEGTCQKRGVYTLGPTEVITSDPFGLFEVTLRYDYQETFVVFPPVAALPKLVEPRGMARGSAHTNIRSLDFTTNASGIRQYIPGDALKRIHWRSTAKRSQIGQEEIYVKEYDLEPSGDLWLVLDLDAQVQAGQELESTEEYAIILAASLASDLLRANHAVGLITHSQEPLIIPPQKGHQQLWTLLRALAGLHAVGQVPLSGMLEMVEPVVGRGMSAVLITPSTNPEWIKSLAALLRRGIHPTAVLLDASSFGGTDGIQGMMAALADLGVSSHHITKGFRFQQITQRRRQRPSYRVLGTGRVVAIDAGDQEQAQWVPVGQAIKG
jgi:uncharacterized protein (DUF58 family)